MSEKCLLKTAAYVMLLEKFAQSIRICKVGASAYWGIPICPLWRSLLAPLARYLGSAKVRILFTAE